MIALGSLGFYQPPDLILSPQGPSLGLRLDPKTLWVSSPKIKEFTKDQWIKVFPNAQIITESPQIQCHNELCQTTIRDHKIVWTRDELRMKEWCKGTESASVGILLAPYKGRCQAAQRFINLKTLWNKGGMTIKLENPLFFKSSRPYKKTRPWMKDRWTQKNQIKT
jgi:hypothetical protein